MQIQPRRSLVRKHVIGPPAERNGRRIEHLAPHIASFVAPIPIPWLTIYTELLASDDDDDAASGEVFYDSENGEYYDY